MSLESNSDINEIISYDDNHVVIRPRNNSDLLRLEESFILTPTLIVPKKRISDVVEPDELDYLKTLEPEVLILTKTAGQQLSPHALVKFSQQSMGVESMLIGAACRTYNLLAAEGRHVVLIVRFD
ncbi:MAG: hypothetical protein GQ547_09860 [Methylophaga sp.]|nr:hypothetical protein [Methylophaga sp.]